MMTILPDHVEEIRDMLWKGTPDYFTDLAGMV
jgi:hypothetical protein